MKKLKNLIASLLLICSSSFAIDGGNGEIITVTTSPIQSRFNQSEKVSVINRGAATVYAKANCSTNQFIIYMTETNAVPIVSGEIYTFDYDNQGPAINSVCLQTLSGTADVTLSGPGTYAGLSSGGVSPGDPVTVTNVVDVFVTNVVDVVVSNPSLGPTALAGTPQDFTASWVDLGAEIDCQGYNTLALWINVDANDSTDMRIRAIAKHTSAGVDEYVFPIKNPSSGTVTELSPQYFELIEDSDNEYLIPVEVDNSVFYVQFQIQAGTVGATAGQIDDAQYTLGYR